MKSTTISEVMIKDHANIVGLLNEVERHIDDNLDTTLKAFDTLQGELEKHIFTEEKAIFSYYNPENVTQGYKMIPTLISQHNELLNSLSVLRRDIVKQVAFDFTAFKEQLLDHKNFEEESFYPKLDQGLTDEQRTIIINHIKEIVV